MSTSDLASIYRGSDIYRNLVSKDIDVTNAVGIDEAVESIIDVLFSTYTTDVEDLQLVLDLVWF